MHRSLCALLLLFCVCYLMGCGGGSNSGPPVAKVSGTVKLDGKPMAGGEVRFSVAGLPAKSLPISGGSYSGEAPVGKNKVEVVWDKDGPPNPTDPSTKMKVNAVNMRFSGPDSQLNAEVKEGENTFNFDVTSAPK